MCCAACLKLMLGAASVLEMLAVTCPENNRAWIIAGRFTHVGNPNTVALVISGQHLGACGSLIRYSLPLMNDRFTSFIKNCSRIRYFPVNVPINNNRHFADKLVFYFYRLPSCIGFHSLLTNCC